MRNSCRVDDKVTHIKIHNKGNRYDVGGGTSFDSLGELIEHYKKCPLVEVTGNVVHLKQVGRWGYMDHVISIVYIIGLSCDHNCTKQH